MRKKLLSFIFALAAVCACSVGAMAADVYTGSSSVVDASHQTDGYVDVKYTAKTTKPLRVTIEKAGGDKYTYTLKSDGTSERFTFTQGNGSYTIKVLENNAGTRYAVKQTVKVDVKLKDQYAPFLVSNQYVNYNSKSTAVAKAAELVKGAKTDLEKVDLIYAYICNNIAYDTKKASSVQTGYLPSVDATLKSKTGICFDYAAIMAAMLRSQDIPTQLVTGFVSPNGAYHAWNEVYIKGKGWIKTGELYFDGSKWTLMDSTFMASSKGSQKIVSYIGDGGNYTEKYKY